jgi:DNA-binding FadR family transcriptional regulator
MQVAREGDEHGEMTKFKKDSAVRKAAKALRADALALADGTLMGSEDELLTRYGISRPTLRLAAALLVQEQLLVIKRGVNGGYFARQPSAKGVAHTSSIYLQSRHTSLREIIQAILPVKVELAKLACRNRNAIVLQRFRDFRERDLHSPHDDYHAFLRSEIQFGTLLGELSDNNVLRLFLETLYDFCSQLGASDDIYRGRPDRIKEYWAIREQLIDAVIRGDEELATTFARRGAGLAAQWVVEDLGARNTSKPFSEQLSAPAVRSPSGATRKIIPPSNRMENKKNRASR